MRNILTLFITAITFIQSTRAQGSLGQSCNNEDDAATMPGRYHTAAQYPWPSARAEYFKDLLATDRPTAKGVCEQIEKLEQNSRNSMAPTGGSLENTFTAYGYKFYNNKKMAAYGTVSALYKWNCYKNKITRNTEFSTVLRVFVNRIPFNEWERNAPIRMAFPNPDYKYFYKDWKNKKPGVDADAIELFNYISYNENASKELLQAINTGNDYWQNIPEKEIKPNSFDHIYRYWFIKKSEKPLLVEVTRKEYLESLLAYFEREKLHLTEKTQKLYDNEKKYYENWQSVIENKKQRVLSALKDNETEWLSKPAIVNRDEDIYQNQKEKLPEYISDFTFRKFYDNEGKAQRLYKMNPAYFSGNVQKPGDPAFIVLSLRYVSKPAHLKLMNNFTKNLNRAAWQKLLK